MRYFETKRRALFKNHYVNGMEKSVSGTDSIEIKSSAGVPFESINIFGNTTQKNYLGYQQIEILDFDKSYTSADGNVMTWSCRNGVVTVNGISDKLVPITITPDNNTLGFRTLKAGTYTFTTHWTSPEVSQGCDCVYKDIVTGEQSYLFIKDRTVKTFENDVVWGYFQPYFKTNTEYVDFKFAIGVFKGDVALADFPPYEPYVGGIPSPSPEYPQTIENANNNGMSILLNGYNLFNKKECKSESLINETQISGYGAPQILPEKLNTVLKPNTKYTMSFDVEGVIGLPEGATIKNGQGFIFVPKTSSPYLWVRSSKIAESGEVYSYKQTFTTPATFYEDSYTLYVYTGQYIIDGVAQTTYPTCIIRNVQITEGTEEKPYEPYFHEEIAIPKSVEVDGNTVELNMCKGNNSHADRIYIKKTSGRAYYVKKIGRMILTGNENFVLSGSGYLYRLQKTPPDIKQQSNLKCLCNFFRNVHNTQIDSTTGEGSFCFYQGYFYFNYDSQRGGVDNFKSWLKSKFDNGTPVIIQYDLLPTFTYDITSTELGRALLDLYVERDVDAVFEVSAGLKGIPISAVYYSNKEANVVNIAIRYIDKEGNEIREPRVNETRKGSKYLIVAPHIDGYTRVSSQAYGVADEDTVIELIYQKG